jgi:hypothetical protein
MISGVVLFRRRNRSPEKVLASGLLTCVLSISCQEALLCSAGELVSI